MFLNKFSEVYFLLLAGGFLGIRGFAYGDLITFFRLIWGLYLRELRDGVREFDRFITLAEE